MNEIIQHNKACRIAEELRRPMSSTISKMTFYFAGKDYWFFGEYSND